MIWMSAAAGYRRMHMVCFWVPLYYFNKTSIGMINANSFEKEYL